MWDSGLTVQVTLWGSHAEDDGGRLEADLSCGQNPVVSLSHLRVTDFNGASLIPKSSYGIVLNLATTLSLVHSPWAVLLSLPCHLKCLHKVMDVQLLLDVTLQAMPGPIVCLFCWFVMGLQRTFRSGLPCMSDVSTVLGQYTFICISSVLFALGCCSAPGWHLVPPLFLNFFSVVVLEAFDYNRCRLSSQQPNEAARAQLSLSHSLIMTPVDTDFECCAMKGKEQL